MSDPAQPRPGSPAATRLRVALVGGGVRVDGSRNLAGAPLDVGQAKGGRDGD